MIWWGDGAEADVVMPHPEYTLFERSPTGAGHVPKARAGAVTLPTSTAGAQYSDASSYGGSYISLSSLQPGDLVFFGSSSSSIDHVGIVVSGTGTSAEIISAISEKYGIAGVIGHRFLPTAGHIIPHWWPSFRCARGHRISPSVAIVSPQQGVGFVLR